MNRPTANAVPADSLFYREHGFRMVRNLEAGAQLRLMEKLDLVRNAPAVDR